MIVLNILFRVLTGYQDNYGLSTQSGRRKRENSSLRHSAYCFAYFALKTIRNLSAERMLKYELGSIKEYPEHYL
jgi:hypothetical protein